MSELYAIEKSTLDSIGSAVKGIKDQIGTIPVAQLAHEINNIATFTVNGEKVLESKAFEMEEFDIYRGTFPVSMYVLAAVVWQGGLYVFARETDGIVYLYKYENGVWFPTINSVVGGIKGFYGHPIVFNGKVYAIFNGNLNSWEGGEWSTVTSLSNPDESGTLIGYELAVYDGKIHILSSPYGAYASVHYTWDGTRLTKIGDTLPVPEGGIGLPVMVNDEIHLLVYTYHYKWNGSSWVYVGTLPYNFGTTGFGGGAAVIDGELHIFGGNNLNTTMHYKWDGYSWTELRDLPAPTYGGAWGVIDGHLHIIGSKENETLSSPRHNSHIELGAKRYKEVAV